MTWRRLPASGWPWRSAGYLFATLPSAFVAAALLAVPAVPWLVLAGGGFHAGTVAALILLGAVLVAALGPLIAIPVAAAARWRLPIVDRRPWRSTTHRAPVGGGVAGWLRARYTDPAAWRATGYACLLATVVPALCVAALFSVLLAVVFIASPVIVTFGGGPVALAVTQVSDVHQTVPYVFAGLALLVLVPYLVTLVAGADAAVARSLLIGGGPEELLRAELHRGRRVPCPAGRRLRGRAPPHRARPARRRAAEAGRADHATRAARLDLPPGSPATQAVIAAHEQAKQLMAELRDLIHGIQPQVLTDLGLPSALRELADQAAIPVTVDAALGGRLPGQAENTAYFAAAEALTNVAKHSGATQASVTARTRDGVLVLEVRDNGRGGADPGRGSGLTGLADRVAVAGGRMLLSSPPGGPTVLRVEVPWTSSKQWTS